MADVTTLSDKALSVFAFAAYHQLGSGQPVKSVVRDDGHGHKAADDAVADLVSAGLAEAGGADITFTTKGLSILAGVVAAVTKAAHGR